MRLKTRAKAGRLGVAKAVITSPACVLVALLSALAYYLLFFGVMKYENNSMFLMTVPGYLIGSLIITGSALLAVSAFAVLKSFRAASAASDSAASVLASSCGCLLAGCGCYSPIVASVLYAVGFGTLQVSGVISALADYQIGIIVILIVVNLALIYHQLGRIGRRLHKSAQG
jgi:hypothetical protein